MTLVPGAADAIRRIRPPTTVLVGVSNQPAAAKGKVSLEELRACHERVVRLLAAEGVVARRLPLLLPPPGRDRSRSSRVRATAASRRRGCCSTPPPSSTSTSRGAGWSATPTSTSRPDAAPGAGRSWSSIRESAHRRRGDAAARRPGAATSPRRRRRSSTRRRDCSMLDSISTQDLRRRRRPRRILALAGDPRIAGFTTNPTLMWKAGLTDYADFAEQPARADHRQADLLRGLRRRRRSEMRRQARMIAAWGENVYVKIPVTTTDGRVDGAARARALRGRRARST